MKILLIKPPINPNQVSIKMYEPLELEYIAAAVTDHEVDIFDMRIEKNLMKKLETFKPDVVGTTSSYTNQVKLAKRILREVKRYDNRIKTVIGGHHATVLPGDFAEDFIDTIFLGYAEQSFSDYIDILTNGGDVKSVTNIGIVSDKGIYFTESRPFATNLDLLPIPARNLTRKYRKRYCNTYKEELALVMTSRGCPYRCSFCACWKIMKGKYATRKVDAIINELKTLPESAQVVNFADDNTIHNIKRAWKLCEMIKKEKIKKKFQMYARTDTIIKHPDLIKELKDVGLENLVVGLESHNNRSLNKLNKKTSIETNNEAIRILKKLGIHIGAQFIIDPGFSMNDFDELLRYICDKSIYTPVFSVLTPLPGTDLFEETCQDLVIKDYDFFDFLHSVLPTKLSRKEFYSQVASLYKKSYSFKRYFQQKIRNSKKNGADSPNFYAYNTDGITFFKLILVHIFIMLNASKYKNYYKSEPLIMK